MARQSLPALAEAVADDALVDWVDAESSARDDVDRATIRQLRVVASLSATARHLTQRWGPFELRGELGRGAFGTVYRAWDPRVGREVALKLLDGGAASDGLIAEARILAGVEHPHVVPVYGADVHDGRAGIWMKLVNGKTLKQILVEQGPFGANEAADIGRALCGALAAVHRQGFVHRDIKAQNVMRDVGGGILLMDFGAGHAGDMAGDAALRGSPAYLAPELLLGHPPTPQSDIYSLGVLLFHLVSGDFPVSASSFDALRQAHVGGRRKLIRDEQPSLPFGLQEAIDSATSYAVEERPSTAGEFESRLLRVDRRRVSVSVRRRVAIWVAAAAALALVSLAVWTFRGDHVTALPPTAEPKASIAVLPFQSSGPSPDDDRYLAAGITADLSSNLSSLKGLAVVSGPSVRRSDTAEGDAAIGRALGVETVLSGSVSRERGTVRVAAALIDTATSAQLWSGVFNRNLNDLLEVQRDVAEQLAVALRGALPDSAITKLTVGAPNSPDAFMLYMRGRYQWSLRTQDSMMQAISLFNDAIVRDRHYALAYAGLSDAYTSLGTFGFLARSEAFGRAYQAAETAVQLNPGLAEAHASLGYALKNRFEWDAAEASFVRAIELKPNYGPAHHFFANFLTQQVRFAEALTEIKRAVALEPDSVSANATVAAVLVMARRYDDAIAQYKRVLAAAPGLSVVQRGLATAYMHSGRFAEAAEAHAAAISVAAPAAEDQELLADMGYLAAVSGRRRDAARVAAGLERRYHEAGEQVAVSIAAVYAGLHQPASAFEWLARAVALRDPELAYIKVDPRWDILRGDSRFSNVLESVALDR